MSPPSKPSSAYAAAGVDIDIDIDAQEKGLARE